MKASLQEFTAGYLALFASCQVDSKHLDEIDNIISRIVAGQARYRSVEAATKLSQAAAKIKGDGVPWFVIGLLHDLECDLSFAHHLHNGDPLNAPTVNEPAHRPRGWMEMPASMRTWERSAEDSLAFDRLDQHTDWDVPRICFEFETFNGFGYRDRGVNSPYLWGGSQHYEKGKFPRDHFFDPEAVSKQIGTAVVLHRMCQRGIVALRGIAV